MSGVIIREPLTALPAITHCGEAVCFQRHHVRRHTHNGFEFVYLSRGRALWEVGRKPYVQQVGEIFLTYPHEQHGTSGFHNLENCYLWIGLRLDDISHEGRLLVRELHRGGLRTIDGCHEVEPLLRGIISQVVSPRPLQLQMVRSYLQGMIALLRQRILTKNRGEPVRHHLPYTYGIEKAVGFLQQNLDRRVTLRELASIATARSVAHFCTLFGREVGTTPAAYHLQLRLNAAREALGQEAITPVAVAAQYGFSSSQHFSTWFRRHFGTTPRKWQLRAVGRKSATTKGP